MQPELNVAFGPELRYDEDMTDTTPQNNDKYEDLLRKVRQLQQKAESTPYEEEAKLFEAKAAELIIKYNIDQNQLHNDKTDRSVGHNEFICDWKNATYGVISLYSQIARLFQCESIYSQDPDCGYGASRSSKMVRLFGTEENRKAVLSICDHLLIPQMMRGIAADKPTSRKDYAVTFANVVANRIEQQRDVEYSKAGALVPVKDPAVDAEIERMFGRVSVRNYRRKDADSVAAGSIAGNRADIGGAKVGDRVSGLLGG